MDEQNIICVPVKSLSQGGADPQPGDEVEATVKGAVAHVEGENAYVHIDDVNDQPVLNDAGDSGDQEPDEDDMRAMASAADEKEGADYEED